ncbi:S10 family peptidase [Planctobacterium marinum]|uniref:S10 family peptidase n=1 Tax=Planctobacterium marinum TaxID=1631968 RepID=UPI001E61ADCA|nr:peptidase S10 [Planctobacterium marinum]MCC2608117.1 peptidase S10 [Planctobacterium marinum]
MKRKTNLWCMLLIALGSLQANTIFAGESEQKTIPDPVVSVTQHQGKFNGVRMDYTATAGETPLKNKEGDVTAQIFSVSYVKDDVKDTSKRPVAFIFNGGPGSASVWLHMGVFGPKKIVIPSDAEDDGAAPFNLQDNPDTVLDVTDLVFIDPVGTGFSRVVGKGETKDYWGVKEDAKSIAQFIRIWLRENGRWNSPKYIGGESYGTTRSAALIEELEGRWDDVSINGILLISTILDFTIDTYDQGNELPYMVQLPTMAATAWYHKQVETDLSLAQWVDAARNFALREYAPALLLGSSLQGEQRDNIRSKLAQFTGLSESYLERTNLRVNYQRFNKELLRDEGLALGRLDSRFKGVEYDDAGEYPETDPSFYGIDGSYTAALNHWVREGLQFNPEREYTIIGGVTQWNWSLQGEGKRQPYLNVAPYIGKAMRGNKDLRVFNAAGYYDFATPLLGAEYALDRNGIDPQRVTYKYYEAGHMMYIHHPSFQQFLTDVRDFIQAR